MSLVSSNFQAHHEHLIAINTNQANQLRKESKEINSLTNISVGAKQVYDALNLLITLKIEENHEENS